jgi:hypothetical protein
MGWVEEWRGEGGGWVAYEWGGGRRWGRGQRGEDAGRESCCLVGLIFGGGEGCAVYGNENRMLGLIF